MKSLTYSVDSNKIELVAKITMILIFLCSATLKAVHINTRIYIYTYMHLVTFGIDNLLVRRTSFIVDNYVMPNKNIADISTR